MEVSAVILLSMVCFLDAFRWRRCLFYDKKCVDHCPRLMHAYHPRCDGQTMSQRTCSDPSTYVIGYTCGWSRCDCNADLLLDEDTGMCIGVFECSNPLPRRSKYRTRRKKKTPWRLPKRVRTKDLVDPMEEQFRG